MALRTSSIPVTEAAALTPADWRRRVELAVEGAARALTAGDLVGLGAVYADLAGWDDRQRAHHARREVTELVLSYRPDNTDAWVPVFATSARLLLDSLERNPLEPIILNHTGVLLYELLELGGAEALFKAALKLDPALAIARTNLDQTRIRKRSPHTLKGRFGHQLRALGTRAKRVAAGARPTTRLRLSLCMIVKNEEEMLPGCLTPLVGVVDEMIVVDTGSTDRTVAIAESFGATVVSFPWNGSFSDARNASLDAATGDWVMYLDADEHLEAEDADTLRDLLQRTWREGF